MTTKLHAAQTLADAVREGLNTYGFFLPATGRQFFEAALKAFDDAGLPDHEVGHIEEP